MRNEPAVSFKKQMEALHKKLADNGVTLTSYVCPHCQKTLQTIQPTEREAGSKGFWDSLKRCYECDASAFVSTWPNGETVVTRLDIQIA